MFTTICFENYLHFRQASPLGYEFQDLYQNNPSKLIALTISTIFTIILAPLAYGIIWFEQDNNNRTLINQLVSSLMWCILIWFAFIQPETFFIFAFGPLKVSELCTIHTYARNAVIIQGLLILNSIVLSRYIFIFHLKNPTMLQDDFWKFFINLWSISTSVLSQYVFYWTPGKSPIHYHICLGEDPNITSEQGIKPNTSLTAIGILSIVLFLIIRVRTFVYKNKENNFDSLRSGQNLFSFIATGLGIFFIGIIYFIFQLIKNKFIKSAHFNLHMVYLLYIYAPVISFAIVIWTYYLQCKTLRTKVRGEILNYLYQKNYFCSKLRPIGS